MVEMVSNGNKKKKFGLKIFSSKSEKVEGQKVTFKF